MSKWASNHSHVHFHVSISSDHLVEQSRDLVLKLWPQWAQSRIVSKLFTDGLSNQLIGWRLQDGNSADMVLVRVYGEITSELVDRDAELRTLRLLATHGQGSSVFATFDNGFCYEFMAGRVLDVEDLTEPEVWPKVARAVSSLHTIEYDASKSSLSLFEMFDKFLSLLPDLELSNGHKLPTKSDLAAEVDFMKQNLPRPRLRELVFCHNDLLPRNMVEQQDKDRVVFIDFEYGCPNHRAFDIANHFCEFAGVGANFDPSRFPDRMFKLKWCREYLKSSSQNVCDLEEELTQLVDQVEKFNPAPHLLWSLWAIIQSASTHLEQFDFKSYAALRLAEYFKLKKMLF